MKINNAITIALLFLSFFLNGQTRSVYGKVISEYLVPLAGAQIRNSENELLGETDFDGQFKINILQKTDSLFFRYTGMEFADIKMKEDCDNVELIMMHFVIYDFISSKKIDRLRKKRYDNLNNIHLKAINNRLFQNNNICYDRYFVAQKPDLDKIGKELKELDSINKKDFKNLKIGDTVRIPFGLDTTKKIISINYSICKNCTYQDYDFLIKGVIVNKQRKYLTLEIKIVEMLPYNNLEYGGKILNVGSEFKYEMKYFEVLID
jgi:hypothetical protein